MKISVILTAKRPLLCIKMHIRFRSLRMRVIFFSQNLRERNLYYQNNRVCLSVCLAMHFLMLQGIELKVGMGVGDGRTRFVGIFSKRPHLGSKVIQGSICLRNVLWPPNLVSRTPDQSVVLCWGQRSCKGHLGSARGQIT